MQFVKCALGQIKLPSDSLKSGYLGSYLDQQSLAYLTYDEDEGLINFYDPDKAVVILESYSQFVIQARTMAGHFLQIPAVIGYRFKEELLKYLNIINVSALKKQGEPKELKFDVVAAQKQLHGPLRYMTDGQIYHLRSGHAVIDGVCTSGGYLIFIQTSIKPYSNHRTGGRAIESLVGKEEDPARPKIIDYYKQLVVGDVEVLYVYLGPEAICSPGTLFDSDITFVQLKQHYGFATPGKETDVLIKATMQTISH